MNNPQTQHLIEVESLARSANEVVIIDCRFDLMNPDTGASLYAQSHIPGAFYFDLNHDLSSPIARHGGRHPFPDLNVFVDKLRACGISDETTIVAYDDNKGAFASRLWYLCHHIGHTRVKILNGGFAAWKRANLPVTNEVPPACNGNLTLATQEGNILNYQEVKTISETAPPDVALIDSREEARYLGQIEPIDPIAGHIPGALNLPWITALDDSGFFKPTERQRERWAQLLKDGKRPVVYCGSGVTACVNLFSLALIGRDDAKLYAGSWSDWCSYQTK